MRLSIRNQLKGTVKSVTLGAVMAEVVVDVDGQDVTAEITRGSAETCASPKATRWWFSSSRPT
jgi:molybdopterin-binding protein